MENNRTHIITEELLEQFEQELEMLEKSPATIHKYLADIRKLMDYADGRPVDKKLMIAYKQKLQGERYEVSSVNSYLSAASSFLDFAGWQEAKVHTLRVQSNAFYPEEKCLSREELRVLVEKARGMGNLRLAMILNTIASTGIRISELRYITVENLKAGRAVIQLKGKTRVVLMSVDLIISLLNYCQKENICSGVVFRTSSGKPVDRSNVWREMKRLCREAGIAESKVFPHNFRHLFAQTFYEEGKDIAKLADVLGHSSIETTRRYIMTTCEEHRKYLEKMNLFY